MLKVAVIGCGPAGIYAANALAEHGGTHIDIFDRVPTPFGLVRYGVAPDHPKIKSIVGTLTKMLQVDAVRFLGNVDVGRVLTLSEMHRHYDAVIIAVGAPIDRTLDIPGEGLPGSYSATDFVAWYSGHPDARFTDFSLAADSVAVIGGGNVALDVCRMLAKSAEDLSATDTPEDVLSVLRRSNIEDIHLLARRGPVQAKFTSKELAELGELEDVDVIVDPSELELDGRSCELAQSQRAIKRNLDILQEWATRQMSGRHRRVHLHFHTQPRRVLGDDGVTGLELEATHLDGNGRAVGTGVTHVLKAQMVLRSIGYRGVPTLGMPFDEECGTIPNVGGRVLRDGQLVPGEYVAGWIKRGPSGVIGTNKRDAAETVAALLADAAAGRLPSAPARDDDAVLTLLAERGSTVVGWAGWSAIDQAEITLGHALRRERSKINTRETLLKAARDALTT